MFLSYSRQDLQLARRLRTDLEALGVSLWSDDDISPGDSWGPVIEDQLTKAVAVIVLLTPNSLRSRWVVEEWRGGLARDRSIIPVLADGLTFADLPSDLSNIQGISLDDDYEGALRWLAAALSGLMDARQPVQLPDDERRNIVEDTVNQMLQQLGLTRERITELEQLNRVPQRTDGEIDEQLAFVVIAFDRQMDPVYKAIQSAGATVGLRAERVIDIHGDYQITPKMLQMIRKCRLVVADLSLERPNVYFELGYARGIGKTVVTIAREGTKIHFDAQDWPYLPYIDSRPLEDDLVERFRFELAAGVETA